MRCLIIISIALVIGCCPSKKLARLIAKNPELVKSDTTFISDTTVINQIRVDTAFKNIISRDTIKITKERLTIKYFNRGDTIFWTSKVEADTIIKEIPVIVNSVQPVQKESSSFKYQFFKWGFISLLALLILILILRKFLK